MKTSYITADEARALLNYDPATGIFTWKVGRRGRRKGSVVGHTQKRGTNGFVRVIRLGQHLYLAHRIAWLITYGEYPPQEIDHINLDPTDNRLVNLRLATSSQNNANQGIRSDNKSGFKGVSWDKFNRKWLVRIRVPNGGPYLNLGRFSDPIEASLKYQAKAVELYGEFARFSNG